MNRRFHFLIAALAATGVLSACGTVGKDVRDDIAQKQKKSEQTFATPVQIAPVSRVTEVSGRMMPLTAVSGVKTNEWLKKIQVELRIDNPTPLSAVVEKLAAQGLNVVSDLPLSSYTYTGRVTRTDADAALKTVLGSVGLDYQPDDVRRLVIIKPMSSRSWFLNIGNRRATYSSDPTSSSSNTTSATTGGMSASTGGNTGVFGSSGTTGNAMTGAPPGTMSSTTGTGTTGTNGTTQSSGTGVAAADDFWASLAVELRTRLMVLVPRGAGATGMSQPGLPPLPGSPVGGMPMQPGLGMAQPMQSPMIGGAQGMADASGLYVARQMGSYSLNPETGAITVQAPHWILDNLDGYIKRVIEMYNTDITFDGELVLVSRSRNKSEGFDLAAFASWASGKYAAVIANNALGGITVSLPAGASAPTVSAGSQAVAGPLVGMQFKNSRNALQIFNDFLDELGEVSVIQRPRITTTSGMPGVFSKKLTDYYNTVSQQAAAGGAGSAATATQNTVVPVDLGTDLQINPRIDISTGLIRAQLTLNQAIQSGTRNLPQTITFGNNTTTINTTIPLVARQKLSGEILLRDGDLIVVGGQIEDNLSADENGLPGDDRPMGGIFGVKTAKRSAQTYYFALRVTVTKRK